MIVRTSAACIQLVKAQFYPNFSFVTLEKESVNSLQCHKLKLANRTSKQSCILTLAEMKSRGQLPTLELTLLT